MRTRFAITTVVAALALGACGSDASADGGDTDAPLQVGAVPVPHGEILTYIDDELAGEDLDLEVVEFTDYIQPNVALEDGSIDANFFQHQPYLDEQEASAGYDFEPVVPVHIEPLALYSEQVASVDELADGAEIAIPNDPTNAARALWILQDAGLLTLADNSSNSDAAPTVLDIEENPKALQLTEIEAAQLPRALADVEAAIINGNYAIEAGLVPADDAIAIEEAEGNPNANLLVVRSGEESDPRVEALAEYLNSDEVREFIEENYEGAVIPAF